MDTPGASRTFFFGGIDAAPSATQAADDGAIVTLRGIDRRPASIARESVATETDFQLDYVFARRMRSADVAVWAGMIHKYHRQFGFASIVMDPHGGGAFFQAELRKHKATVDGLESTVVPLITRDDGTVLDGLAILSMMRLRDPGIQRVWPSLLGDDVLKANCHREFKRAVDLRLLGCPKPTGEWRREEVAGWTEDERFSTRWLDLGRKQLGKISVATGADGLQVFTSRGVQKFLTRGHDDFAMAMIYAYIAFLVWLRMDGPQEAAEGVSGSNWRSFASG